jgi:hypothetical protein
MVEEPGARFPTSLNAGVATKATAETYVHSIIRSFPS